MSDFCGSRQENKKAVDYTGMDQSNRRMKGVEECQQRRKSYRRMRNELRRATGKQRRNIWRAYITISWHFKEQDIMI